MFDKISVYIGLLSGEINNYFKVPHQVVNSSGKMQERACGHFSGLLPSRNLDMTVFLRAYSS